MTTSFHEDGSIDFEQFQADIRRLEEAGVDGVVSIDSTGESAMFTHDEHAEVVEAAVEVVEEVPVIAGSGSNSTREASELSRCSTDTGADALFLILPYYNKSEQAGLVDHYRTIVGETGLPQIVYNVPDHTGSSILPRTAATLAEYPNITGYKAANGDLGQISEVVERTRDGQSAVLSDDDALTLPTLSVGGVGAIPATVNAEPARVGAIVHSTLQGNYERARNIRHDLAPLSRHPSSETNPIPVKEAMEIRGYGPARLRLPFTRLTEENIEELRCLLSDLEVE